MLRTIRSPVPNQDVGQQPRPRANSRLEKVPTGQKLLEIRHSASFGLGYNAHELLRLTGFDPAVRKTK